MVKLHQKKGVLMVGVLMSCEVHVAVCTNDNCSRKNQIISYSGISKGLVNVNNKFVIGIELIQEYLELYSKTGMKFSSWIKVRTNIHSNSSETPLFKKVDNLASYYGYLHQAFCSASELFLFDKADFYCCASPEVIQIDATVNSIQLSRLPTFKEPWVKEHVIQRTSTRNERQLPQLNETDKKIISNILKGISCSQATVHRFQNHDHVGLKNIGFCMMKKKDNQYILNKSAEMFCKCLIKNVAASSSILPTSCVEIVSR